MSNRYEIGFIITPDSTEEDVKKIVDSVVGIIKKNGGKVENVDEWGIKKLAYPIDKHSEGYFYFFQFESDGNTVAAVEKRLRQIEKVLRFITLRLDDKLKKSNKLTKKWKKLDQAHKKFKETKEEGPEAEDFVEKEEETTYAS